MAKSNTTHPVQQIFSAEDLDALRDDSALTIEGLAESSIPDLVNWIERYTKLRKDCFVYKISGETLNTYCGNTGNNRYPDDLTIVAVKLSNMEDCSTIFIPRFEFGGRWFDDIVANNRRREAEKRGETVED